jgi:hypothetical protein
VICGDPTTCTDLSAAPAATSAFAATPASLPPKPAAAAVALGSAPDFEAARRKGGARPGADQHDALLPADYLLLIPAAARAAFEMPMFEWGNIPEMVPPIELR